MRVALLVVALTATLGQVVISEVSDSGVPNFCNENDWIELYNRGDPVNLEGWQLCDSDGCADTDALTFGNVTLQTSEYLAVCHNAPANRSIHRWIGKNDTITLYNSSGIPVDTSGQLGGEGEFGRTWARPNVSQQLLLHVLISLRQDAASRCDCS